jgi:hypothetical protein
LAQQALKALPIHKPLRLIALLNFSGNNLNKLAPIKSHGAKLVSMRLVKCNERLAMCLARLSLARAIINKTQALRFVFLKARKRLTDKQRPVEV